MGWNPAILNASNGPAFPSNVDSITIERRTGSPGSYAMTQIFSGTADLQEGGGGTYITPAGAAEEIDARLFIDLSSSNPLPDVQVNDIVTNSADSKTFTVVAVARQPFIIDYLEIILKRGALKYSTR